MSKHLRAIESAKAEGRSSSTFGTELTDAEKLKIKSGLVNEIIKAVRKLGLTQGEASRRMGISQPKVSALLRQDFTNLSERKLMDCLSRLGYDIEIKVKPTRRSVGHLTIAAA